MVCFDLDGTVMLRPNSLQYLCALNQAPDEVLREIDRRETSGRVEWIAADYERALLIAGLSVAGVEEHFDAHLETIGNLGLVLSTLRQHDVITVVITSGPVEVAQALGRRFAFDYCFGSTFETASGVYTGRITRHLGSIGKVDCLRDLCHEAQISLDDCAAVGDGESDLDLFQVVGTSIGINCSADTAEYVTHEVRGRDLAAILPLVLGKSRS